MIIDHLLDKKERIKVIMLRMLVLNGGSLPYNDLKDSVGLSKPACDNYVLEINQFILSQFKNYNLDQVLKNDGYHLILNLPDNLGLNDITAQFVKESIKYQILDYLLVNREFSIGQIVTTLSLSESTVFRKIKDINTFLKEFQIQIKNGRMSGEELQIRYFYYQINLFVNDRSQNVIDGTSASYQLFENALKKQLKTTFSQSAMQKIHCWLYVTQKRLIVPKLKHKGLSLSFDPFLNDTLYKSVDQLVSLYFSRSSIEDNVYESQMFYIFLVSFFILNEEYYYHYDLLRKKKLPTARLDVYIRETILLHYRPRRIALSLEKKVGYNLSQINNQLYFFKGKIQTFEEEHLNSELTHLLGKSLIKLPDKLLDVAFLQLNIVPNKLDGLQAYVKSAYSSVLSLIDFHSLRVISIGLDFEREDILGEPFRQLLTTELFAMNGVVIKDYVKEGRYDLIITMGNLDKMRVVNERIYCVSEFKSLYDIKKIKEIIYKLKRSIN